MESDTSTDTDTEDTETDTSTETDTEDTETDTSTETDTETDTDTFDIIIYGDFLLTPLDDDTLKIIKYKGTDTFVELPTDINGQIISSIGENIFTDNSDVVAVMIPSTVTDIDKNAFSGTDITIYGESGSYAEEYANENGIPFVSTSVEYVLIGDASLDGNVNSIDALMILRCNANLTTLTDKQTFAADVSGDGAVNSLDALAILRYNAGTSSSSRCDTYEEYSSAGTIIRIL